VSPSLPQLRVRVKRAFSRYYLDVCSPAIADPSEAAEALALYFARRRDHLGETLFRLELEDDVSGLAGEIEQDLRQRYRDIGPCLQEESLEGRLRECVGLLGGSQSGREA
jgi:hypothetical protein